MKRIPQSVQIFLAIFPFISVFLFPWPVTLTAAVVSGLVFPPLAFFVGVLVDIVYLPAGNLPLATLTGAVIGLATYAVRHFVKTRIM